MATYRAARGGAAERHIATMTLLNGIAGVVLSLASGVLLWSSVQATSEVDVLLRGALSSVCLGAAVLNGGLAYGLSRLSRAARAIQVAAAVLSLPLFPLGTIWGMYALWVMLRPEGRRLFAEDQAKRSRQVARGVAQPYYVPVMLVVAVSFGVVSFSTVKAHELWLARTVRIAAAHEASQRAAVGRSMQRLRDLSADDLIEERARGTGSRSVLDGAQPPGRSADTGQP